MNLGELFIEIGVKGNPEKLDDFEKEIKKVIHESEEAAEKFEKFQGALFKSLKQLVLIGGALAGAYWAMDRLTQSLARQNIEWLNLARQSSIALETYQKWGTIGQIAGVSGIGQQIQALDQRIFSLKLTGEGARGFQIGGIMPTNAEDVLNQLRNRVSGINNTAASYLLQQMGLSPELLTILRMGKQEWKEYLEIQKKFTLNKEQRKELDRMNRQLEVARIKMQYMKDNILLALLPLFLKISQVLASISAGIARVVKWLANSSSGFATFSRILLTILAGATAIVAVLVTLPAILKAITLGVYALRAAFLLLTAHPIIAAVTALLGLLMLVADDLYTYFTGGQSVLGVILKGLEDLDIKGMIDFPIPEWLKALLEVIHWQKNHKGLNAAFAPLNALGPFGTYAAFKLEHSLARKELGLRAAMSSSGQQVYYETNHQQSIPIKQDIIIYTTESAQQVDNSLRYAQQMGTR